MSQSHLFQSRVAKSARLGLDAGLAKYLHAPGLESDAQFATQSAHVSFIGFAFLASHLMIDVRDHNIRAPSKQNTQQSQRIGSARNRSQDAALRQQLRQRRANASENRA